MSAPSTTTGTIPRLQPARLTVLLQHHTTDVPFYDLPASKQAAIARSQWTALRHIHRRFLDEKQTPVELFAEGVYTDLDEFDAKRDQPHGYQRVHAMFPGRALPSTPSRDQALFVGMAGAHSVAVALGFATILRSANNDTINALAKEINAGLRRLRPKEKIPPKLADLMFARRDELLAEEIQRFFARDVRKRPVFVLLGRLHKDTLDQFLRKHTAIPPAEYVDTAAHTPAKGGWESRWINRNGLYYNG